MSHASAPLQTAMAYYEAWTSGDLETALGYIADDIVCDAPGFRVVGAQAYRDFIGPFTQYVTRSQMIAAFGDDETALIMYETDTVPVKGAPAAECLTVADGKITHSRFVFDSAPFKQVT